ncbi:tRNA 4-thiouridine(8) synthase ThiI [Candidatus Peregrinibacteria bacterium]|nr:tRNA 4-thiouridine(8) synthase ThiI [Candidatus Peregrinibacteria bacterium]
MKRFILIHYSEIGLKKSNKRYFIEKLRRTLRNKLSKGLQKNVKIIFSLERFLVEIDDIPQEPLQNILNNIFGIRNYQFVFEGSINLKQLAQNIMTNLPKPVDSYQNFRVCVKRSQKFSMNSTEIEREMGTNLIKAGLNLPVKLRDEDLCINIEIFNNKSYFSYEKLNGLGGMPTQSSDKLLCLLSSGIDSPVSAFRMMRRGARVIYIHFHSYPYTDIQEIENVKSICRILSEYQNNTTLYLIPFADYMKSIASNKAIDSRYRVLLYRRMMLRGAERLAFNLKAKGLITGDNLAQVASQTAKNLFAIHSVTKIPLYQPLISYDKEEICRISRKIGTYQISKLPCKDTCSIFAPPKPEIACSDNVLNDIEGNIDIHKHLDMLFDSREKITIA